jgi:hypothetical protein
LEDGKHFVSGGFDHFLNVYNFRKRQLVKAVDSGEKIAMLSKLEGKSNQQYIISGNLSM